LGVEDFHLNWTDDPHACGAASSHRKLNGHPISRQGVNLKVNFSSFIHCHIGTFAKRSP
jgi:hypothetical protein